jgi:chemotaxis protein methyltransferase CheR
MKHFAKTGEMWQVSPALRAMVQYQQLNLLSDLSRLGAFDVVFCRNVLIYFDQRTKADVLERISRLLPSDGYLFLGGAETVLGVTERFVPVQGMRGIYAVAPRTRQ